ncbi:MAG: DUF1460 domain-containing protein [Phycisphaerales bacterium]|nr:DUF1460 domain-containing protein [Phycisphaerales bacterium]
MVVGRGDKRNPCSTCWATTGITTLLGFVLGLSGCAAAPREETQPNRHTTSPTAPAATAGAALADRPLYQFAEEEFDDYLPWLLAARPVLTDRIVHLARQGLGQPYEIYLLGEFPFEWHDPDPIYCLTRSDCVTFCEHIYALALSHDWWSYLRTLQRIRYRDGIVSMLTRNHYTVADWNRNNAYLFEDLTSALGDGAVAVSLQQICRRANFFAKFGIGQDIPDEPIRDAYLPKGRVHEILSELRDGDFVNIIRGDADSQWAGHTGLIVHGPDGTVHFLHSARPEVREEPLLDYLASDRRCVGIKILRLWPDAEARMAAALESPDATPISRASVQAALARSPLMNTGAPPTYALDWRGAMQMQAYRLDHDTPVDHELQAALIALDRRLGAEFDIPDEQRACGMLDLRTQRLALVRPDEMFYGASVPKIIIAGAYFAKYPEAAATLDPETERELELMIKRSSNELAAKYSQLIGLEFLQSFVQSPEYRFYDAERGGGLWCGKHYGLDAPRNGDPLHDHSHGATVRQCLRYYLLMEQGKLVSATASARLKRIFAAPALDFHSHNFVGGLRGRHLTLLRKSGQWEDWHLDTARVQHGDLLYLLAAMVHHPRGQEYLAALAAGVDDLLGGSRSAPPAYHQTLHHTRPMDFAAGTRLYADFAEDVLTLRPAENLAAVYESPVWTAPFPFNEALLSWNLTVPEGAQVAIEIRVGWHYDDSWSPYLHVGFAGAEPPDLSAAVFAYRGGKIDVDYFVSPERYDRVQYRLRALAPTATAVRVERMDLTLSDTTGLPLATPRPGSLSPHFTLPPGDARGRLPVPFHNQRTEREELFGRLCSPASVSMVLAYRGVDSSTLRVAQAVYDPVHDIYGNWPRQVQAAWELGVPGYLTRIADWATVEHYLASDQPLIASIRVEREGQLRNAPYGAIGGHLIVLTGFDAEGGVYVNDSGRSDPEVGQRVYLRTDLEDVWMRGSGGVTYILEKPRE